MKTKHAHIIEAMRLPSVPVVFPKLATDASIMTVATNGHIMEKTNMARFCICCHLPITGSAAHFCNRKTCVDIRAAAERQRETEQRGKFILQYETFDAKSEIKRFDDEGERNYHASLMLDQVVDMFGINPDGTTVNFH